MVGGLNSEVKSLFKQEVVVVFSIGKKSGIREF
jgi:hypothetical protein